ncbi:NfeD family protein [Aerosakkonemataceae cyanobacterium BLCC-F154]|uniref:NfeD family protein n=1 Tax=Floridaenema fluviatile BLCC-F154 TaxID=3153640 RepID=A0ABV4YIF0_9CYAN
MLTIEVLVMNINMLLDDLLMSLVAASNYSLPSTELDSLMGLMATAALSFTISPTLVWLLFGTALCLVEFILPTAYTAVIMGVAAMIVALVAPVMPSPLLQVIVWLLLSGGLFLLFRRLTPKRKSPAIRDAVEAQTISEILPGQTGRVLYEGNSWRARCSDETKAIAPNEKVYVIGREGTTLIVLPDNL